MTDLPAENSLDLPFEECSPTDMHDIADASFAGGVIVMASVMDVPDLGRMPSLVFRFVSPTGQFYKPLVLVATDEHLAKLRPLIVRAVQTARRAAKGHPS